MVALNNLIKCLKGKVTDIRYSYSILSRHGWFNHTNVTGKNSSCSAFFIHIGF